jgi:predicted acylesterase/phospholipase RssA
MLSSDRVKSGSASIPGVFPPIEIDGLYYADGGATSNLFVLTYSAEDGPIARFRERHPEAPMPKYRVWVLVSQQLLTEPAITQPRWFSVAGRGLDTALSTGQLFALDLIVDSVKTAEKERGLEVEFHYVSIPDDAPKNDTGDMFDRDYMIALEDLGREMGADPSSWKTEIPSAYWSP